MELQQSRRVFPNDHVIHSSALRKEKGRIKTKNNHYVNQLLISRDSIKRLKLQGCPKVTCQEVRAYNSASVDMIRKIFQE